jgi:Tfp pilus assembly protein PilO
LTQRILGALSRIRPQVLLLAMILIASAAAFEGWYLVLRRPLAEYRQLAATRESLAAALEASANRQGELSRLTAELKELSDRLAGELRASAPDDQLAVSLMTELDHAAARKGVTLTSVKPGARRQVLSFDEVTFDVGAQGKYLLLCEWLLDFEVTLGRSATITDFTMRSTQEDGQVGLTLKVALYRPLPGAGAGK